MSPDPGTTHYVGDGCQPGHDPRIDQAIEQTWRPEVKALRAQVERLQRENGSLARMNALTQDILRERTGRLNQAEAEVKRLRDAMWEAYANADVGADTSASAASSAC